MTFLQTHWNIESEQFSDLRDTANFELGQNVFLSVKVLLLWITFLRAEEVQFITNTPKTLRAG